jgi:hypothetical protein
MRGNLPKRVELHVRRSQGRQIDLGKCLPGNDERLLHEVKHHLNVVLEIADFKFSLKKHY